MSQLLNTSAIPKPTSLALSKAALNRDGKKAIKGDQSTQKTKDLVDLDTLSRINESFHRCTLESRRRFSKDRLKMLQNISYTSSALHSRQLTGSAAIFAVTCSLTFLGLNQPSKLFESASEKMLSAFTSQYQARIKEFEIWYQAEQERIAKSREDERAHLQKWEQHLQSEHSSKLRFFS